MSATELLQHVHDTRIGTYRLRLETWQGLTVIVCGVENRIFVDGADKKSAVKKGSPATCLLRGSKEFVVKFKEAEAKHKEADARFKRSCYKTYKELAEKFIPDLVPQGSGKVRFKSCWGRSRMLLYKLSRSGTDS